MYSKIDQLSAVKKLPKITKMSNRCFCEHC